MKTAAVALVVATVLAGCASYTLPPPDTQAIVLDRPQVSHYFGSTFTVTLPAGRYAPAFQSEKGTFYQSPSMLLLHAIGNAPVKGGIFVPAGGVEGQRLGFWYDNNGQTPHVGLRDHVEYHLAK